MEVFFKELKHINILYLDFGSKFITNDACEYIFKSIRNFTQLKKFYINLCSTNLQNSGL